MLGNTGIVIRGVFFCPVVKICLTYIKADVLEVGLRIYPFIYFFSVLMHSTEMFVLHFTHFMTMPNFNCIKKKQLLE